MFEGKLLLKLRLLPSIVKKDAVTLLQLRSFGMRHPVVWYKDTNVSELTAVSIFKM